MYFLRIIGLKMTHLCFKRTFYLIIFLFLILCSQIARSQDTTFVKSYAFDEPVANIDGSGEYIIVRTTNKLYKLNENDEFEQIASLDFKTAGNYTWLDKSDRKGNYSTYNTEYIPRNKLVGYYPVGGFLPGYHHSNITLAMDGNNMFVTFRGDILSYKINTFFNVKNRWESVRDVYIDDSIKITSTYSAIYRDYAYDQFGFDTIKGISYSNGEVSKIDGKYYLCADELWVLGDSGWKKSPIQSGLRPDFRKLATNRGKSYYLSLKAFGVIDLQSNRIADTLLNVPNGEFFDIVWHNGKAYLSNKDGYLYIYKEGYSLKKVKLGSAIYDINIVTDKNEAILSCRDGVFKINLNDLTVVKLLSLHESFETIFVENELLISTSHGLYINFNGEAKEIIPRIEFNKFGLSHYGELIFAGSIEGLYVIDKEYLLNDKLKSLKNSQFKDRRQTLIKYSLFFISAVLIIITILFVKLYKKRSQAPKLIIKKSTINPETIRLIVKENPQLISVESIAEYFETSTVQLNRILKKYNTSGLALLKEIKQDIVKDLVGQGKSIEEISQRVGYSVNYIKRNLL